MNRTGGWRESVKNHFTFPPRLHQTRSAKVGEMARNFRLWHAEDVLKLADAMFALGEQI